jgi:Aminotransferase class-III
MGQAFSRKALGVSAEYARPSRGDLFKRLDGAKTRLTKLEAAGTPAGLLTYQYHMSMAPRIALSHLFGQLSWRRSFRSLHRATSPTLYPNVSAATAVEKGVPPLPPKATAILHRTPWQPPVAVSGQGIYITLEEGREVIDAVGGAAVVCIGNGHPVVQEAIKEQVDKLACE